MKVSEVTAEWLKTIDYKVVSTFNGPTIEGVKFRKLNPIVDGRGDLIELWSEPWEGFEAPKHVYQSATDYGVVKGWHLHAVHSDQMTVTRGKVQITAVDIREDSKTFGQVNVFILGTANPGLLRIEPGILHGWKALSRPEIRVVNVQTHVYDPADEFKFEWDTVLEDVWEPKNG